MLTRSAQKAKDLLDECGIDDPTEFPLDLLVAGRGATLRYIPIENADGRIVFGKTKSIITINSELQFEGRRRFTIAHELGHHEMHRGLFEMHTDNDKTLSWYNNKVKQSQKGRQELEANQFAAELLMPTEIFKEKCSGRKFSPDLIRDLSDSFKTSRTSSAFRFLELGNHPICIFYCHNNKVVYWKKSTDFRPFITDRVKLPPPDDSVATEFFDNGKIYAGQQSKQQIWKSTWFETKDWENDTDSNFFEYCIITPNHNTVISIVWEEA